MQVCRRTNESAQVSPTIENQRCRIPPCADPKKARDRSTTWNMRPGAQQGPGLLRRRLFDRGLVNLRWTMGKTILNTDNGIAIASDTARRAIKEALLGRHGVELHVLLLRVAQTHRCFVACRDGAALKREARRNACNDCEGIARMSRVQGATVHTSTAQARAGELQCASCGCVWPCTNTYASKCSLRT